MKRTILLILSLVLVLALMGCGGEKEDAAAEVADNNMLASNTQTAVTDAGYLEYDNSQVTCRFRKEEETWKWVDNEEFPLDAAYIEEILAALEALDTTLTPVDPAVDPADCGLDESERYLTVTVGEETTTLRFGDQSTSGEWYMSVDGSSDVYLAADAFVRLMDRSIYDMAVLPTLPELTEDNLTAIAVRSGDNSRNARMTKTDEGWVLENRLAPEKAEAVETALAEFSFDICFNFDPSPDAAPLCGLDVPSAVISVAYINTVGTETTMTLSLGTLRQDGFYYVTLNDDTTVYLVSQDKVAPLLALL